MFDPKSKKYPYPEYTDMHYLKIKKDRKIIFDENYQYIDKSKSFKFKQFLVRILLRLIVFPMVKIRLGLKIYNKGLLKKYKKDLKEGIITVSNHIHMWDYLAILRLLKPIKPYVLVWDKNINGESGNLVRLVGGIPIPIDSLKAKLAFLSGIKEIMNNNKCMHVYPEGSMWELYPYLRPFKKGAFRFAYEYDKKILPLVFSFRKPSWIRRCIFKQEACLSLSICEMKEIDKTLDKNDAIEKLTISTFEDMVKTAGIEDNPYQSIFKNDKKVERE